MAASGDWDPPPASASSSASSASISPSPSTSAAHRPRPRTQKPTLKKTVIPVSDDWEDDDDDDDPNEADEDVEEEEQESLYDGQEQNPNQRIWADANARPPPPPALVVVSSSSSTSGASSAVAAAFLQPQMRILKRPPNTAPVQSTSTETPMETIKEREARYRAARERIFGGGEQGKDREKTGSSVTRNPKGPLDAQAKGFVRRGRGDSPSSSSARGVNAIRTDSGGRLAS
ncbi:hypothetical protein R3P38DRAFT_326696 [Favolaschia claudopus]|uniref:SUZ domain-containing protein n=1 Tax=Favolaschia claudopus TaxID=2862362 RepID=A0AAW0CXA5_9AGAR